MTNLYKSSSIYLPCLPNVDRKIMDEIGAIQNPRHVKPHTHKTPDKHNQDTSNLRHIKPQTKSIGLSTTQQMKIPFL